MSIRTLQTKLSKLVPQTRFDVDRVDTCDCAAELPSLAGIVGGTLSSFSASGMVTKGLRSTWRTKIDNRNA